MQTTSALELIADRFVRWDGAWYDVASGERVLLHLARAGPAVRQVEWAEGCDILASLRHPLVQPLIDFGAADGTWLFEAYAPRAPIETSAAAGCRLMTHAVRFLDAHGVVLTQDLAGCVFRPVIGGRFARGRPLGIVLQHRKVLDAVAEVLAAGSRCGVTSIAVAGPAGYGVRTLRTSIARMARTAGYVPVCADWLARRPWFHSALAGRHVCLLHGPAGSRAGSSARARLLAALGVESTRGHVSVTLHSCADPPAGALVLDPIGVAAMTAMVYTDPDFGPGRGEIVEAAHAACGSPGRFVQAFQAIAFDAHAPQPFGVHESPAPFAVEGGGDIHRGSAAVVAVLDAGAGAAGDDKRRVGAVLAGAGERAVRLAAAGRHAAALRLLRRAERVQARRGLAGDAAHSLLQMAWILRDRGDIDGAAAAAARAKGASDVPSVHVTAALALAVCWTDARRFVEAEAALRTALAAAIDLGDEAGAADCRRALARTLLWSGQLDEALETLAPLTEHQRDSARRCAAAALAARVHANRREIREAIGAARTALGHALRGDDLRLRAASHRAMAEALCAAGDLPGVREHVHMGLDASVRAHLPLAGLRLRAVLVRALAVSGMVDGELPAARGRLKRAAHGSRVPPLVRALIASALDAAATASQPPHARPIPTVERTPIEDLLVLAHRAPDDRAAVDLVAAALVERLRAASALVLTPGGHEPRLLAAAGRPWRDRSGAAAHALASGLAVVPGPDRQPYEAAAPVRYAEEILAAIACRWTAGTAVHAATASAVLRAAALAIAPNVRALLEASAPAPLPAGAWGDLLGESAPATILREAVLRAARAPFPVLIEGESGSGKELVARAIHRLGPRRDRRFCAINCAAISDELVEAELFGHARGSFTGASAERAGLFEEADGGTLFLDEIGELTPRAQAKLLRVLQDGEVRRVGENLPRRVDVRIVAATNRRLEAEAAAGRFRADLRFRLDVIRVAVPPLRDRVADIPLLAAHFWQHACARVGSRATLAPEALAALSRYDWPGNVRELQNAMAWMAVHAPRRGRVGADALPSQLAAAAPLATGSFEAAREDFERRFVRAALARTGGRRTQAAEVLGVSRQGLAKMMRRLGIEE
jgi:DNA-binding NtrC family response regulator/tetratricopeptide (TPR) repeat protein